MADKPGIPFRLPTAEADNWAADRAAHTQGLPAIAGAGPVEPVYSPPGHKRPADVMAVVIHMEGSSLAEAPLAGDRKEPPVAELPGYSAHYNRNPYSIQWLPAVPAADKQRRDSPHKAPDRAFLHIRLPPRDTRMPADSVPDNTAAYPALTDCREYSP